MGGSLLVGKSREFENNFPLHLGKRYGILTNSGSSANLVMVHAFTSKQKFMKKYHLPKGSKIITPVVCFPTTINPIIQAGFEPVFVDVDLPSLNLNLDKVEENIRNRQRHKRVNVCPCFRKPSRYGQGYGFGQRARSNIFRRLL